MNRTLGLVILTAGGFAAGLSAGLWMGRNQIPTPPPPAWLYSEFNDITRPGSSIQQLVQDRPDLWREINAELVDLKPRIDAFRGRLHEIDSDFRRDLDAILNENQRKKLIQLQQRRELPRVFTNFSTPAAQAPKSPAATPATTAAPASPAKPTVPTSVSNSTPRPPSTPKVFHERTDGMVASFVFTPYTQARFAQALDLDEEQEEKLGLLLAERRTRFLKLCDDSPPPSLQLNRIAEIIRRAEQEKK